MAGATAAAQQLHSNQSHSNQAYSNVQSITDGTGCASQQAGIWIDWNVTYSIQTSASAAVTVTYVANGDIWNVWNQSATGSGITYRSSDSAVWNYWNQLACGVSNNYAEVQAPRLSEADRQCNWDAAQHQAQAARVIREEADKKAEAILLAHLSPSQQHQYRHHRYFELITKNGRYRLYHGWAGNVKKLRDSDHAEVDQYCIHPSIAVPYADNLLAQKLMLELDEDRFLKTANRTRLIAA